MAKRKKYLYSKTGTLTVLLGFPMLIEVDRSGSSSSVVGSSSSGVGSSSISLHAVPCLASPSLQLNFSNL
jgi:hypothetical protein